VCCSGACLGSEGEGSRCSGPTCFDEDAPCAYDADCCSGVCERAGQYGRCLAVGVCRPPGHDCTGEGQCCEGSWCPGVLDPYPAPKGQCSVCTSVVGDPCLFYTEPDRQLVHCCPWVAYCNDSAEQPGVLTCQACPRLGEACLHGTCCRGQGIYCQGAPGGQSVCAACFGAGEACGRERADEFECCSGYCHQGTCLARGCVEVGGPCGPSWEGGEEIPCCSGFCNQNRCLDSACVGLGGACSESIECCDGLCHPLTHLCTNCGERGATCMLDANCCSGHCREGTCSFPRAECVPDYHACDGDNPCCAGSCVADGDAFCQRVDCTGSGAACSANHQCCSGSCLGGYCEGKPAGAPCSSSKACASHRCVPSNVIPDQGTCEWPSPCTPMCEDNACVDGCGGDCGGCGEGRSCRGETCCQRRCEDVQCGPDGCGGQCPSTCGEGQVCNDARGLCCTPRCGACGTDGCGHNCPNTCGAGQPCIDNACCTGTCAGKQCGWVCGVFCGGCPTDHFCNDAYVCQGTGTSSSSSSSTSSGGGGCNQRNSCLTGSSYFTSYDCLTVELTNQCAETIWCTVCPVAYGVADTGACGGSIFAPGQRRAGESSGFVWCGYDEGIAYKCALESDPRTCTSF
jgi:hypothetical protein